MSVAGFLWVSAYGMRYPHPGWVFSPLQTPSQACPECVFSVMVIPIQTPSHWITFPGVEWGAGPEGSPPSSEQSGRASTPASVTADPQHQTEASSSPKGDPVCLCRGAGKFIIASSSLLHISRL